MVVLPSNHSATTEDELLFNDIISRFGPSVVVVFLFLPSPNNTEEMKVLITLRWFSLLFEVCGVVDSDG